MRDALDCLQIWDAQTSMLVSSCRGHQHDVSCLTVNCTDAILASGSYDCFIRTWGLEVGWQPVCCDVCIQPLARKVGVWQNRLLRTRECRLGPLAVAGT